jgi:hypothetical protein
LALHRHRHEHCHRNPHRRRGGRSRAGRAETKSVVDPRRDPSWFTGPPYALAETVFDEYDFAALRPVAERDVTGWEPERRQG